MFFRMENINPVRIFYVFVLLFIVFILTYFNIFIINEEILIVFTFTLFLSLVIILFSDVFKNLILEKSINIKNKFYDLKIKIKTEVINKYLFQLNYNIYNDIPYIWNKHEINYNAYELFQIFNIWMTEINENETINNKLENQLILNILENKPIENYLLYREHIELLNIFNIIELFNEFMFEINNYNINDLNNINSDLIEWNKNKILNLVLEYIKFKENSLANIEFINAAKNIFIKEMSKYSLNKQTINEIMNIK